MPDACLDESTALAVATGRGSEAERALAVAHLDGCETCRELVAALAKLDLVVPLEAPLEGQRTEHFIGDRYHLKERIAVTQLGEIHEAHDLHLDIAVAVRVVERGRLAGGHAHRRLRAAVADARRLAHPGICRVYDLVESESGWLLASDLVRASPLSTTLPTAANDEATLMDLMLRIVEPLAYAHEQEVTHGDLRPENILVDPGGHVTLTAFGLARAVLGHPPASPRDDVRALATIFGPRVKKRGLREVIERCLDDRLVDAYRDGKELQAALLTCARAETRPFPVSLHLWDASGEVVDGRFYLEARAAHGGMGTVYRAVDLETNEPVAVKLVQVQPERFYREVGALEELSHPAVVRYIAHGRHQRVSYIAMEWLQGESLAARLEKGPLDPAEAIALVRRVAEAVGEAHRRGLVHRDLKPDNIMMGEGPKSARVLDFGLSRRAESLASAAGPGSDSGITHVGAIIGTAGFMSPEQARGAEDVDSRSDVFSLGCILFQCLTGERAFGGEDLLAVLAKTVLAPPPRLLDHWSDAPDSLTALIDRMLAKDRDERPRDGAEVARLLEDIAGEGDTMMLTTVARRITRRERRAISVLMARPKAEERRAVAEHAERAAIDADAQLERLVGGTLLLHWRAESLAEEHLARAARVALGLAAAFPELALSLATGEGERNAGGVMGDAVDRAIRLLDERGPGIPIDAATETMVRARFEVVEEGPRRFLRGELRGAALREERTPLFGRDAELSMVVSWLSSALGERAPRVALVTGDPGIGKSRLRREVLRQLRARHPELEVWFGRCDAAERGSSFSMIADAVRTAAGIRAGEPARLSRDKLTALVDRSEVGDRTRVLQFVGELTGTPMPDDAIGVQLAEARKDRTLMRDQIHLAWMELVRSLADTQPLVLMLEDVHWGDRGSLALVDAMLRAEDVPLSVLVTARNEVRERFGQLFKERQALEIQLPPLSGTASRGLARALLGEASGDEVVERIVARAEGNPFYIEELAHAEAGGVHVLPGGVLAMVRGRLEAMEPDARRVLRAASIFGRHAWVGGIVAVLGGGRGVDVDGWVEALVKRAVLVRHPRSAVTGEREVSFRHAIVRDAAYAMLTDEDRTLGHRLAGTWLEKLGVADPVLLGQHFEHGELPKKAARWWAIAAEAALAASDVEATVEHATRAITAGIDGHDRGYVLRLVAEAELFRGGFESAERAAAAAMDLLVVGSEPWCDAAVQRAEALQVAGEREALVALATRLANARSPSPQAAALHLARSRFVFELRRAGCTEEAQQMLDVIDTEDAGFANVRRQAFLGRFRAMEAYHDNRLGLHIREVRQSVRLFLQCGDRRWAARERRNLAFALVLVGQYEDAERELEGARAAGRALGLGYFMEGAVLQCLGLVRLHQGDAATAREHEAQSAGVFVTAGAMRMEGFSRVYLARACIALDRLDEAEEQATLALERFEAAAPIVVPYPKAVLANVALQRGDVATASRWAIDAVSGLDAGLAFGEGESFVRLAFLDAMIAAGNLRRVKIAAKVAKERLLAHAAELDDPLRKSFLSRVPTNVRTLQLASDLTRR